MKKEQKKTKIKIKIKKGKNNGRLLEAVYVKRHKYWGGNKRELSYVLVA